MKLLKKVKKIIKSIYNGSYAGLCYIFILGPGDSRCSSPKKQSPGDKILDHLIEIRKVKPVDVIAHVGTNDINDINDINE